MLVNERVFCIIRNTILCACVHGWVGEDAPVKSLLGPDCSHTLALLESRITFLRSALLEGTVSKPGY